MPNTQTVRERKALLVATEFDGLERQISYEGINLVFFNGLIEQLRSEGQGNLVSFLRNLVKSGWIGSEDKHRFTTLADAVQGLTTEQWEREFWGVSNNSDSSHVPFVLPQLDISTFTGREDELRQLEEILLSQQGEKVCSIVGLTGGGGIGKSALACHFATIHQDKFPDGVVGLRVDNKDVDTIAREFARQIGKPIDPDDDLEARSIMQELFASRRMLLIFDNAEEADIKVLRPGGNLCAVIVTTRNQNLPFSLDVSENDTIRLQSLSEQDALDLLKKILGESRIETAIAAAQRVAQMVGRLPLALQVVGAALRGKPRSFETYADSLQAQKDQLKLLPRLRVRGDDELNVEASLNLSLESLEEEEIDFFACLSVCAEEGFAIKTAMAATGYEDEWEAEEFLDKLYELSLLNYTKTEQDRFVLHPLVQEYAKSLAQERNLLTIAKEHHAQFFVEWLQSDKLEDVTVVAEVATNLDDVILAAEWLQNHDTDTAQRKMKNYKFALQLQPLFEQYGYWKKAITLMARFQSWAEQLEDWNAVVKYQTHEARYLSFEEQFERAEEILNSARINLHKIADRDTRKRREAKVLNVLGGVFHKQAKTEEAIQVFRDEILIEEEIGNDKSLGIVCNRLGNLLQSQDKLEEAQQAFERRVAIAEALNDKSSLAIGLNCLGGVLQQQGKLEQAQQTFERGIEIAEALNDKSSRYAWILHNLGRIWKSKGEFEEAELILKKSQEIFEEEKNLPDLAKVMNTLGSVLEKQQKWDEAEKILRQSYDLAFKLGDKLGQAIIANSLGQIMAHQGGEKNFKLSEMYFRKSIKLGQELDNKYHLAKAHTAMGQAFLAHDFFDQAVDELTQGFEIDESLSNIRGLKIVTPNLTYTLSRLGKREEALTYCERAITIAPNYSGFLQLREKIQAAMSTGIQQTYLQTGLILYIKRNKKDNFRWGRIAPDDGSLHITFNEKFIGSKSISKLTKGALVEVEVKKKYGKLYATQISVIEDEEEEYLSFDRDFYTRNELDTELY
ncbi:MAG: tetratricopeptide repeat protein [Calothrix sp. MO_167.B12]|nr:tetratricopeptide repeat protein [Calothrix sp. MO_167.B12]